jgi:hypothetical protein
VDTFGLVGPNDNTAESSAFLKEENSVRITTFILAIAGTGATVKAGISIRGGVGCPGCNRDRLAQRRGLRWCREGARGRTPFQPGQSLSLRSSSSRGKTYGDARTAAPRARNATRDLLNMARRDGRRETRYVRSLRVTAENSEDICEFIYLGGLKVLLDIAEARNT